MGKTIDESGAEVAPAPPHTLTPADRGAVLDAAMAMLDLIPDAVDDDGSAIIAQLINADNWEDLNRDPKLPAGQDLPEKELVIRGMVKRVSDIEPEDDDTGIRLPYYLVIDSVYSGKGTEVRWQTSAPALVIPLMKLQIWNKLPAVVVIHRADKPTKKGFRPLNLEVLSVNG